MDTASGEPEFTFRPTAYLRSVALPAVAVAGFVAAAALFEAADTDAGSAFMLALMGVFLVLLGLPFVFRLFRAAMTLDGNRYTDAEQRRALPNSRTLGLAVLGAVLVFASFVSDGIGPPPVAAIMAGLGTGLGIYAVGSRFAVWEVAVARREAGFLDRWPPAYFVLRFIATVLAGGLWIAFLNSPRWLAAHADWARSWGFYFSLGLFFFCLVAFYRQAIELALEPLFWVPYAIRGAGPSAYRLPPVGPVIVIANHCSWLDPVFVTKVLPRPITPMMTSRFYDIWFLRPFLKYVFKVIVVPDVKVRREAPELKLAIAALDRGDVLVIFPEGALRRKDDVPIKRFGQGVWMILKERPTTPVVSCWIEGSWGSYFSHFHGPPTKNKRMDFRTPIRVGMNDLETVLPEMLEDGMLTRVHLMNRVLAARDHLGLPSLPAVTLPAVGEPEAVE